MNTSAIREARFSDAADIARLVTLLGYPASAEEMANRLEKLLARQEYRLFVAEADEQVVGFTGVYLALALEFDAPYGRLIGLAVDESYRGLGIGRRLMERVESWLGEQGAGMLIVTSGLHRQEAHRFYQALGYRQTGLRFMKQLGPISGQT